MPLRALPELGGLSWQPVILHSKLLSGINQEAWALLAAHDITLKTIIGHPPRSLGSRGEALKKPCFEKSSHHGASWQPIPNAVIHHRGDEKHFIASGSEKSGCKSGM
jgi:hypothetical protein